METPRFSHGSSSTTLCIGFCLLAGRNFAKKDEKQMLGCCTDLKILTIVMGK